MVHHFNCLVTQLFSLLTSLLNLNTIFFKLPKRSMCDYGCLLRVADYNCLERSILRFYDLFYLLAIAAYLGRSTLLFTCGISFRPFCWRTSIYWLAIWSIQQLTTWSLARSTAFFVCNSRSSVKRLPNWLAWLIIFATLAPIFWFAS